MAIARIYAAQPYLLKGELISIEADISRGLHSFSVVGVPERSVEEAKDRVSAAIKNSGFASPKSQNQKIVISLSPADLKKEGAYFDLGIALAYLLANEEIIFDPSKKVFLGELALDGTLKSIKGVLALVEEAKRQGFSEVFIPESNKVEAALVPGIHIFAFPSLEKVIKHLSGEEVVLPEETTNIEYIFSSDVLDMGDIRGQESAKRGLEIAASGGHNIALIGSPGTGKTMLARAFRGILPYLDTNEVLEVTGIHSISGMKPGTLIVEPPFRCPHHTASYVSVIGGGATPRPGEVTLAHRGVLFLDEFPEFDKRVIESLRQPLEDKVVSISRAKGTALFPSNFILIAAMNPCPCGNALSQTKPCTCTSNDLLRYKRKLSGPIVDRIDIWITVPEVSYESLQQKNETKKESESIKEKIQKAREIQKKRFAENNFTYKTNSDMDVRALDALVALTDEVKKILLLSAEKLNLSARAYHRVIKLARTIADLEGKEEIESAHILEAFQYRPKI